ncbi:hypothetical protein [Crucian carp herpesvirus]|uniref:ORF94 n=1 Tax=Cyprinid herpesvirus 2 TaxID=317878 RepID=A0A0E3T6T6_CYHV2|nr:hypothetical protein [Cyprinid herpesvirus 2]AMB21663.1 ORF94 [Cyprinid herpesvirus 2]APB92941.2 hypothetical protein [Crucian carp herpesvirus]QAU54816.1 protein ORF94 [Cyprinid herpesvirus 2]QIM55262.1 hypothetical protein [Cyprinid herpesvirus 2]
MILKLYCILFVSLTVYFVYSSLLLLDHDVMISIKPHRKEPKLSLPVIVSEPTTTTSAAAHSQPPPQQTTTTTTTSTTATEAEAVPRRSDGVDKIMGGMTAIAIPPYMGMITSNANVLCGGTLFNSTHVLTAAHCCINGMVRTFDKLEVTFGLYSVKRLFEQGVVRYRVKACHFYAPDFLQYVKKVLLESPVDQLFNYHGWDITLMELHEPVLYREPVKLFKPTEAHGRGECLVAGYGSRGYLDDRGGDYGIPLKTVHVPLVDKATCDGEFTVGSPPNTLCAGSLDHDACNGDSGGPLMCESPNDDFTPKQLGIVSYGKPCRLGKLGISVYTDIRPYLTDLYHNQPTYTVYDLNKFFLLNVDNDDD